MPDEGLLVARNIAVYFGACVDVIQESFGPEDPDVPVTPLQFRLQNGRQRAPTYEIEWKLVHGVTHVMF